MYGEQHFYWNGEASHWSDGNGYTGCRQNQ
jgi:hypothetical protein